MINNVTKSYYETEISRNPYHLKTWIKYIDVNSKSSPINKYIIFERALKFLPRSYKIWLLYIKDVQSSLKNKKITDKRFLGFKVLYERSLVHLNKMPKIWLT
jgi:pre-mRNA-splicing factor SYF1